MRRKPRPATFRPRLMHQEFPEAERWGIMGPIGGSWASDQDWKCAECGCRDRLVVWGKARTVLYCDCFDCWAFDRTSVNQLSFDLE